MSSSPSLGLASQIIGFISFSFTLATLVRVFWSELNTFLAASSEIEDYLTNLKQGLYEEKWHLKQARRRLEQRRHSEHLHDTEATGHGDRDHRSRRKEGHFRNRKLSPNMDISLRAMQNAVKHMVTQFNKLEESFLREDMKYGYEEEKGFDEIESCYQSQVYKQYGFKERWRWLRVKSTVVFMSEGLSRITIRRVSVQVAGVAGSLRNFGYDMDDLDDRLHGIENRLSRIVGVRRVQ